MQLVAFDLTCHRGHCQHLGKGCWHDASEILCGVSSCSNEQNIRLLARPTDGLMQRIRISNAASVVVAASSGETHRSDLNKREKHRSKRLGSVVMFSFLCGCICALTLMLSR